MSIVSIAYYESGASVIHWDNGYSSTYIKSQLPQVGVQGVPFVVEADGQRIYMGSFWTGISSWAPPGPTISVDFMKDDQCTIDPPWSGPDPRSDPRILKVLAETGKLVP